MRTELFSSPFWKVKVPNHNKIKEKYLDLFIKGYEDNIYKIPEGWTTHKCHTSFEQKLLFDEDIHDEYESIFKSIFGHNPIQQFFYLQLDLYLYPFHKIISFYILSFSGRGPSAP